MRKVLSLVIFAAIGIIYAQKVAIVKGMQREGTASQNSYDTPANRIRDRLNDMGVDSITLPDNALNANMFQDIKLAIFPYNPTMDDANFTVVRNFVNKGGKIAVFYNEDPRFAELLEIEQPQFYPSSQLKAIAAVKFDTKLLPGLPDKMNQASWCLLPPVPKKDSRTKVIGRWVDKDGKDIGHNAAVVGKNGAAFAHIYLNQSPAEGARFLFALVAMAIPDAWKTAAQAAIDKSGVYRHFKSFDELYKHIAVQGTEAARIAAAEARDIYAEAQALCRQKKYEQAILKAQEADRSLKAAYAQSIPPRMGELRGVWIHSPYGIADWGWDKTVKVLAENGFNAIFPNMLWSYVADYESDVLPRHPSVATRGDQIKLCLEACRKYGVEMHVWKVCWNMGGHTPAELVKQMQDAKLTQVNLDGKPSLFLAPHIPENLERETKAFIEIVRKYHVDGIHFDYIRYPDPSSRCDYSDSAREAFEKFLGKPAEGWPKSCTVGGALRDKYNEWRRDNIDKLVKNVHDQAKAIRPDIKISAAVYANWESSPNSIAQSAIAWIENGWLDFVCPMDYIKDDTPYIERLTRMQVAASHGKIPLYIGIGSYEHSDAAVTSEQIDVARKLGADGFLCFQHDTRFATSLLPAIARNATSKSAGKLMPHHSPYAKYTFKRGKTPDLKEAYALNETIQCEALFPANTSFSKDLRFSILKDGYPLDNQPTIKTKRSRTTWTCRFACGQPGSYRLEITDGKTILSRSQPIDILDDEDYDERVAMFGAPRFANNGKLKVAVWQDTAYGAKLLLESLKKSGLFDAAPLYNLRPTSIKACKVIILPQPRQNVKLFQDADNARLFQDFMSRGGGVVTTHALVGIRGFFNLSPAVVSATGLDSLKGEIWKPFGKHEIAKVLPAGEHLTTFVDFVLPPAGKQGTVVASTPDGKPLVTVGKHGKGRYVACGIGLGIGRGDSDIALPEADEQLLFTLAHWAGGQKLK